MRQSGRNIMTNKGKRNNHAFEHLPNVNVGDYDYELPEDKIAQYPIEKRDNSKLLVYKGNEIVTDHFINIVKYLPENTLLVFNNTKVIKARLLFQKKSGAWIELLCLEPILPHSYEKSLLSKKPVEWKCMIGNLKKWTGGSLSLQFFHNGQSRILTAQKVTQEGDAWRIRFEWSNYDLSFGEVIEYSGHVPLPPYIKRTDTYIDQNAYQTVYSRVEGSVAAPTAGLHFTGEVLKKLSEAGIRTIELTLHVGAGTFQPVKSSDIKNHEMHSERFYVTNNLVESLFENSGKVVAVGTTSVRTLESLYWMGIQVMQGKMDTDKEFIVGQWEPYLHSEKATPVSALKALSDYMKKNQIRILEGSTSLLIVPGYEFRIIKGLITNFHLPRSTLLMLISAWVGDAWKKIYDYAIINDFRFLSYGDSSLLLR